MNRLTACLITRNEEDNLPRALASLKGIADEIVVVDCGSTDRTVEMARENGARVLTRAWTNYSEQRNFAAEQASHDWILAVDADEEISEELSKSIREWKAGTPQHPVYEMARRTWYLGAWIRHSGWYPDYIKRLYRRDAARFAGIIHESVSPENDTACVGRLRGDLLHYTVRTFAEHEEKVERYTTLSAQQMYAEGKRNWRAAVWLATPWAWFRSFVLQLGFLDGYRGAVIAQMAARAVRLKYKKLGRFAARQAAKTSQ